MLGKIIYFNKIRKSVYLDNASSTPIDRAVVSAMRSADFVYANPSSIHSLGVLARKKVNESRVSVAQFINSHPDEVVFTSGGTEGDNLAIIGTIKAVPHKKPHIIISKIEHSAVLSLVKKLQADDIIDATFISVDQDGLINLDELRESINDNTILISIHLVNNEIGTLEPLREVVKIVRHFKKQNKKGLYPLVHTDAAQATPYIKINVQNLGVDMLSFNGQKIYGPHGIGVLYVKRGTPIESIFIGGDQEFGLRPGTESVSQIVGLAKACSIVEGRIDSDFEKLNKLRNYFISQLKTLPGIIIHAKKCLVSPHIVSVEFQGTFSESLVLYLDARGIYVASKSACRYDDPNESYVLNALKYATIGEQTVNSLDDDMGAIRFSLGRNTTKSDIDYVIKNLKEILKILGPKK